MSPLSAIILGLVEGITEYLPVSSTGHLIIAASLLGLSSTPDQKSAIDAFTIVIQGGAILAVLGLYRARVAQMIRGLLGRDAVGRRLAINILIAFLPAAILGPLFDKAIELTLFRPVPVIIALALGGVWMIWLDRRTARKSTEAIAAGAPPDPDTGITIDALDPRRALLIGLMQCIAMVPGTSRSMMTIAGGVVLGMRRKDAAEFSFLLGLPTLGAACLYKLAKNLYASTQPEGPPHIFDQLGWMPVILGIAVATVSAAFAVKWLVGFLTRHGLAPFGWYRIALAAVLGGLIAAGIVTI
jgi:undecaprenyl-diphosphatase